MKEQIKQETINHKNINFKLNISAICMDLINLYVSLFFSKYKLKSIYVELNFRIKTNNNLNMNKDILLNLPFFWVLKNN